VAKSTPERLNAIQRELQERNHFPSRSLAGDLWSATRPGGIAIAPLRCDPKPPS
jgi:hypothetical protein